MGIDGVVAVAVLDDDGEPVRPELSYQPHRSGLYRLHWRSHAGCDAHTIPADDAATRKRVPAESINNSTFHRPVEVAQVRSRNRARSGDCAPQRAARELIPAGTLESREQAVQASLVLLELGESTLRSSGGSLQGLKFSSSFRRQGAVLAEFGLALISSPVELAPDVENIVALGDHPVPQLLDVVHQ